MHNNNCAQLQYTAQQQQILQKLIEEQIEHQLTQSHQNQSTQDQQQQFQNNGNIYFDKQLAHLVITQHFDFEKISQILSSVFIRESVVTSEAACRNRWAQLYRNRIDLEANKQKVKENKRIRSVAAFKNPYSLYSVDELIQNLQLHEKQQNKLQQHPELSFSQSNQNQKTSNYNIFKDSFRRINDMKQYDEMHEEMLRAMSKAQSESYEQKPMLYTPEYDKSSKFSVKEEELTADRAKKLMAFQIQMDKINRQLTTQKKQLQQQQKYESIIKKKIVKQQIQQHGDFDEDWDAYESD